MCGRVREPASKKTARYSSSAEPPTAARFCIRTRPMKFSGSGGGTALASSMRWTSRAGTLETRNAEAARAAEAGDRAHPRLRERLGGAKRLVNSGAHRVLEQLRIVRVDRLRFDPDLGDLAGARRLDGDEA